MLKLPSNLTGYTIYQIDDENLDTEGAEPKVVSNPGAMKGKGIYAFYSACSGEKPYRF
jgi:hypothetical protein